MIYAIVLSVSNYHSEFFILGLFLYWGLFVYFALKIAGTIIVIIGSFKNKRYVILGVSILLKLLFVS